MTTDIEITRATPEDEPLIKLCAQDAFEQYIADIGQKPAPMIADYGSLISSGSIFVAKSSDKTLLGFIVFYQKDNCFLLQSIAVRSDATGKGIGKRMIAFCEEQAKQSGVGSVKLCTNEKMLKNISIYPHLGYHETVRRAQDGFNRVFFKKIL